MTDELEVAVDLGERTVLAGIARVDRRRNTTTTSFRYDPDYLADPASYPIDPALPFESLGGVVPDLPGAFADCAPDRWGRRLIAKWIRASETGTPRTLGEVDYLLGVSDHTRQGALRFRLRGAANFQAAEGEVPRQIRLPELLRAAEAVASGRDDVDTSTIKVLLDAGTGTLGGARPKASVISDDDVLSIAKFPHPHDEWDVMAWEKTALDLAEHAGIDVPRRLLVTISGKSVLLLERFDRRRGHRVGYVSGMTVVQGRDGDDHDYLDLAAELGAISAAADDDLAQLWRRIAFSVAIHNTDDHLRNHGVIRAASAWRLSPVFDVNPNPDVAEERVTGIGGATARADEIPALLSIAADLGLRRGEVEQVLAEVGAATATWRETAAANGIAHGEIRRFEGAFEGLRDEFGTGS